MTTACRNSCREKIEMRMVRFALGCWPLTGAVESSPYNQEVVEEMMTTTDERTTRVIDFDQEACGAEET